MDTREDRSNTELWSTLTFKDGYEERSREKWLKSRRIARRAWWRGVLDVKIEIQEGGNISSVTFC